MRVILLLLCLAAGTLGYLINVPTAPATQRVAQMDWIRRQKVITSLFQNFCEDSTDDFIVRSAQDFMTYTSTDFVDSDAFARLKALISSGVLAKGIIFTEYNREHFKEFEIVRDVLYHARNFEVFFKAAAWARQNLNCGVFIDVFYSALTYRKDTEKLSLPAPYEMMPNYFFKRDDIVTGASLMAGTTTAQENVRDDGNSYVITSKYTTDMAENDFEGRLAYFHEDVGLNTYIFLNKLISKESWNQNAYGEYLYHFMKQLVTRYHLERYSNSLPELQSIDWDTPISEMYDPMLIYSNGNNFDFRTKTMNAVMLEQVSFLKNVEANIAPMVTRMMQNGFDKTAILNNLVDVLVTGESSYESIAFMNLGKDVDSANTSPSVLEHYMTLARDPIFWIINKRMVDIIDKAISIIPTYSRNELYFPGVEVVNVEMKALTTSFNMFEVDVTEALKSQSSTGSFLVKMSQPRLSHAPFSMKLNISSVMAQKGFAKIYLGPKMLPGQLAVNKNEFMLLDSFEVSLKRGGNSITRTSANMKMYTNDFFSMKTLFKKIEDAEFGLNTLSFDEEKFPNGFPSRLLIPKGAVGGMPFQLFVFIAPMTKVSMTNTAATNEFNSAVMSPGYPLDLNIENWQLFDLPNALVKDIMITHKESSKGSSNGNNGGGFRKPFNEQSQEYFPQPWEQKLVGRQMAVPTTNRKTNNNKVGKPIRPESTLNNKFEAKDNTRKIDNKSKKTERTTNKPGFDNKIDQWAEKDYIAPKMTDNSFNYSDKESVDAVINKDFPTRSFVEGKGVGGMKNIDKTIDKTVDNTVKNAIKSTEKEFQNVKNIDKNINTVTNDQDKTKDITINKFGGSENEIDDTVHKVIYVYDFDDDVTGDRKITVDTKTIDDSSIDRMFGFGTEKFVTDPVLYKNGKLFMPFLIKKDVNSLKNIDKTIDKTVGNTVSNVVKTIDRGFDYVKSIDKNIDSMVSNQVKKIDITNHKSVGKTNDMDKKVDDTVHKVIYTHASDDSLNEDKTITVDAVPVNQMFDFDTVNVPVLRKGQTIYDYVIRKPKTEPEVDPEDKVYE